MLLGKGKLRDSRLADSSPLQEIEHFPCTYNGKVH